MNNKWNSVNIFKRNFDVRYEYLTQQIKQIMNETLEEELIKTKKKIIFVSKSSIFVFLY